MSPEAPAFRSLTELFTSVFEKKRHPWGLETGTPAIRGLVRPEGPRREAALRLEAGAQLTPEGFSFTPTHATKNAPQGGVLIACARRDSNPQPSDP